MGRQKLEARGKEGGREGKGGREGERGEKEWVEKGRDKVRVTRRE